MTAKKILLDVCAIRLILIILLVLYHAFAIFCDGWTPLDNYPEPAAYWWIGKSAYSFMLEAFVFISGYVYGYQIYRNPEKLSLKAVVQSKLKRLILPSIIFSTVYYLLFYDLGEPIWKIVYSILCGTGHMWFLPMLFWCFIFTFIAEKTGIRHIYIIMSAFVMVVISAVPLPLRLSSALYYFLFFYTGYLIKRKAWDVRELFSSRNTIASVSTYLCLFVGLTMLQSKYLGGGIQPTDIEIVNKGISIVIKTMIKLSIGFSGVIAMYSVTNHIIGQNSTMSQALIDMSSYCFGIYIYQQFILKYLYYYTELPYAVSPYLLPWAGFAIALVLSFVLTYLTRKTKFGNMLIG